MRTCWPCFVLLAFASSCRCGGTEPVPDGAVLISDTRQGNDEDPWLIEFSGGSLGIAFFSERTGGGDVYLRSISAAGEPGAIAQLSTHPSPEHYPSIAQASDGHLDAVWFRKTMGRGQIIHAVSRVVGAWGQEGVVTSPAQTLSDWTPAVARDGAGALVVVFSRDTCFPRAPCFGLMITRSVDEGASWSPPAPLHAVAAMSDFVPTLRRTAQGLALTWNRYAGAAYPWETANSETMVSSSADGISWSAPQNLSNDDRPDAFPTFLGEADGGTSVVWLSVGKGGAELVSAPLGGGDRTTLLPAPVSGYSHRVCVLRDGRLFVTWVQGEEGARRVWARTVQR